MFEYLPEVCRELNANIKDIYWILIVPFTVLTLIFEFFKMPEGNPNPIDVIKRVAVSIMLLMSFDFCINTIAMVGDGITEQIQGIKKLQDLMGHLEQNYTQTEVSWLKFREAVIFILNLLSYIIAYTGVFVANVLIHFVWSILYVCSPLMILMYISKRTSFVTSNLYKGLINVISWKILWSILAVMLLKMATSPEVGNWDSFLTTILVNLCIGLSMLFIPLTTKSLISDGMESAATGLAAAPLLATGKAVKEVSKRQAKRMSGQIMRGTKSGYSRLGEGAKRGFNHLKENLSKGRNMNNRKLPNNVIIADFKNKGKHDKDKH